MVHYLRTTVVVHDLASLEPVLKLRRIGGTQRKLSGVRVVFCGSGGVAQALREFALASFNPEAIRHIFGNHVVKQAIDTFEQVCYTDGGVGRGA